MQNLLQREKEQRERERERESDKKKLSKPELAKYKADENKRAETIRKSRIRGLNVAQSNTEKMQLGGRGRVEPYGML